MYTSRIAENMGNGTVILILLSSVLKHLNVDMSRAMLHYRHLWMPVAPAHDR